MYEIKHMSFKKLLLLSNTELYWMLYIAFQLTWPITYFFYLVSANLIFQQHSVVLKVFC